MAKKENKVFLDVILGGDTTFTLTEFEGIERLSSPFEYTLSLASESRTLNFNQFMGKEATVSLKVGNERRTYSGIIGHFEQDATPFKPLKIQTNYKAILYPKMWLLNFAGQCRIFQNKSTLEIIKEVLREHEVPFENMVTQAGLQPREFCVQYNETDFNFISRLMETEGIFYFFDQDHHSHKLVLADAPAVHAPCPFAASASFHDAAVEDQFMLTVSSCLLSQRIVPQGTTFKSYNYLTPRTSLNAPATGVGNAGGGKLVTYEHIYDHQSQGEKLAKIALQAEEFPQKRAQGLSTVPFFLAGYKFKLKDHPREDANIEYTLYEVYHKARLDPDEPTEHLYENSYVAFPSTIPFKAPQITPKPYIYGTQTAKVTGKEGEEIYTEEYGRIKVKFHWDPSEKNDESTSCWIRVATLWSGQNWGTLFTPRVGQEVVVSFIDGNPDKPLIVGSVYNGDHKPPYLPSDPTKSTVKTQTSKSTGGQTGYNELRFEDKRDHEEVYLQAQKDYNVLVKHDKTSTIERNETVKIVKGNRTVTLEAKEGEGNDSLTLENGNKSIKITRGNYSTTLSAGNMSLTCSAGNVETTVTGDINTNCQGSISTNLEGNRTTSIEGDDTTTVEGVKTLNVEGDTNLSVEGAYNTNVDGEMETNCSGAHTTTVEGAMTVECAGAHTTTVEGAMTVECAGAHTTAVEGAMTANCAGAYTLASEGVLTINCAGVISVIAEGVINIAAPAVNIDGLVLINGMPPMPMPV